MLKMDLTVIRSSTCIILMMTGCLIKSAYGQTVQFPGGSPPVISTTAAQTGTDAPPSTVTDTNTGRQYAASYDATGRLVSLKSVVGRSAFNLRSINYLADGRISSVYFGNRYELDFRYRNDGTQNVVDPIGGSIVRTQTAPGQFVTQTVLDPSGFLVPSLRRLEVLLARFGQVPGLSSATSSAAP